MGFCNEPPTWLQGRHIKWQALQHLWRINSVSFKEELLSLRLQVIFLLLLLLLFLGIWVFQCHPQHNVKPYTNITLLFRVTNCSRVSKTVCGHGLGWGVKATRSWGLLGFFFPSPSSTLAAPPHYLQLSGYSRTIKAVTRLTVLIKTEPTNPVAPTQERYDKEKCQFWGTWEESKVQQDIINSAWEANGSTPPLPCSGRNERQQRIATILSTSQMHAGYQSQKF